MYLGEVHLCIYSFSNNYLLGSLLDNWNIDEKVIDLVF